MSGPNAEPPEAPRWRATRLPKRVDLALRVGVSRIIRNRAIFVRRGRLRGREILDIGCGPNTDSGVIGMDYQWRPGVDICWDASRGIPLPDATVAGVFSEHCIEHLPLAGGVNLLRDSFRVLRPGGTVRIITPDGEQYARAYAQMQSGAEATMPRAAQPGPDGILTPIMSVNRVFNQYGHRFIWDFDTLRSHLEAIGFTAVVRSEFGTGRDPRLVRDTEWRRAGSLYVEATKPA